MCRFLFLDFQSISKARNHTVEGSAIAVPPPPSSKPPPPPSSDIAAAAVAATAAAERAQEPYAQVGLAALQTLSAQSGGQGAWPVTGPAPQLL